MARITPGVRVCDYVHCSLRGNRAEQEATNSGLGDRRWFLKKVDAFSPAVYSAQAGTHPDFRIVGLRSSVVGGMTSPRTATGGSRSRLRAAKEDREDPALSTNRLEGIPELQVGDLDHGGGARREGAVAGSRRIRSVRVTSRSRRMAN
jgi:hypothetical protein